MKKFGYIAFEELEVYDIRNSITEAREDAHAIIEQLGGKAIIIKFEIIEILRDEED